MKTKYADLNNLRVLIVDDDDLVRDSLSLLFEFLGCQARALDTAEKGEQALRKDSYDAIISDHRLPGMSGLNFLKLAGELSPRAPRILVTGYGDHYLVSAAREEGIEGYLEKPLSVEDLCRCLRKVLGHAGSTADNGSAAAPPAYSAPTGEPAAKCTTG